MLTSVPPNLTFVSSFHHYYPPNVLYLWSRVTRTKLFYGPRIPDYVLSSHFALIVRMGQLNSFLDAELWWIFKKILTPFATALILLVINYDSYAEFYQPFFFKCLTPYSFNRIISERQSVWKFPWNIFLYCVSNTFKISGLIPEKILLFVFELNFTASCPNVFGIGTRVANQIAGFQITAKSILDRTNLFGSIPT